MRISDRSSDGGSADLQRSQRPRRGRHPGGGPAAGQGGHHRRRDHRRHLGARIVEIIRAAGAEPAAVLIALDRQERAGADDALSPHSAVQDVAKTYGMPVVSIASLADILALLQDDAQFAGNREAVLAYRGKYGIL